MNKEEVEFRKRCDETLYSIYSKINEEEKKFLSYVINQFNNVCESNNKAIEYLEQEPVIEVNGEFRNIYSEDDNKLLEILKGNNND